MGGPYVPFTGGMLHRTLAALAALTLTTPALAGVTFKDSKASPGMSVVRVTGRLKAKDKPLPKDAPDLRLAMTCTSMHGTGVCQVSAVWGGSPWFSESMTISHDDANLLIASEEGYIDVFKVWRRPAKGVERFEWHTRMPLEKDGEPTDVTFVLVPGT